MLSDRIRSVVGLFVPHELPGAGSSASDSPNWIRWLFAVAVATPCAGFCLIPVLFTQWLFALGVLGAALVGALLSAPARWMPLRIAAFVIILALSYPVGVAMFEAACQDTCFS